MGLFKIRPSNKDPLLIRFDNAVAQYQELFREEINTVTIHINKKAVEDIERCVKERIRLEEMWPELKEIKDEDDI